MLYGVGLLQKGDGRMQSREDEAVQAEMSRQMPTDKIANGWRLVFGFLDTDLKNVCNRKEEYYTRTKTIGSVMGMCEKTGQLKET